VQGVGTVTIDGIRCSSTAVRAALSAADLRKAELLLGSPYRLIGRVKPGLRLGRDLGMPTANIPFRRPPALRQGVYAVRARFAGSGGALPAVASLGARPTLGMSACVLETFVLDRDVDLYGSELQVEFVEFLRPQERFTSLDALSQRMRQDAQDARDLLLRLGS
jgi:riboflavin kinase/FMN adenylyltransferase